MSNVVILDVVISVWFVCFCGLRCRGGVFPKTSSVVLGALVPTRAARAQPFVGSCFPAAVLAANPNPYVAFGVIR